MELLAHALLWLVVWNVMLTVWGIMDAVRLKRLAGRLKSENLFLAKSLARIEARLRLIHGPSEIREAADWPDWPD